MEDKTNDHPQSPTATMQYSVAHSSVRTFATNIIVFLLGFVTSIVIARMLGPEGRGEFIVVLLIPNILMMFGILGVSTANIVFMGRRTFTADVILGYTIVYSLVTGLVLAGVAIIVVSALGSTLLHDIRLHLIVSALGMVPFLILHFLLRSLLQATGRIYLQNILAIVQALLMVAGTTTFLVGFSMDATGPVVGWIVAEASATVLAIWLLVTRTGLCLRLERAVMSAMLNVGIKAWLPQ